MSITPEDAANSVANEGSAVVASQRKVLNKGTKQVMNSLSLMSKNANKTMNEGTQQFSSKIHLDALPDIGQSFSPKSMLVDSVGNLVNSGTNAAANMQDLSQVISGQVSDNFNDQYNNATGFAANGYNNLNNTANQAMNGMDDQYQQMSNMASTGLNNASSSVQNQSNEAMGNLSSQFQQASNGLNNASSSAQNQANQAMGNLNNQFQQASNGLNNASSSAQKQANQAMGNLNNQFQQVSNLSLQNPVNQLTNNMNNQMQQATSGVSNMSNQLKHGFASPMQGANTMMSALNGFATPASGNNMASMMSAANGFAQGGGGGGAANMANSMMSAAANGFGANSPVGGPAGMANMANGMMSGLGNQAMSSMMAAAGMQSPSAQTMIGQYSPLASNGMAMLNNGFNTDNNRQQQQGAFNFNNNNNSYGIADRGNNSSNSNSQSQQPEQQDTIGFSKGGGSTKLKGWSSKMKNGSVKMSNGARSGQIAPLDIEEGGGSDGNSPYKNGVSAFGPGDGSKGAFDANGMLIISDQTRQLFMKDYVISAYDHDLKDFIWQRRWCFRLSNLCETTSLLCMGASAVFGFLGANGNQTFALIAGVISTVGIVLRGISHHASQESKESSVKLNALLKSLNMQGMNILSNGSAESGEE